MLFGESLFCLAFFMADWCLGGMGSTDCQDCRNTTTIRPINKVDALDLNIRPWIIPLHKQRHWTPESSRDWSMRFVHQVERSVFFGYNSLR